MPGFSSAVHLISDVFEDSSSSRGNAAAGCVFRLAVSTLSNPLGLFSALRALAPRRLEAALAPEANEFPNNSEAKLRPNFLSSETATSDGSLCSYSAAEETAASD